LPEMSDKSASRKLVTPSELGRYVIELLGLRLKEGSAIDVSKLRDGSVLLRKAEP